MGYDSMENQMAYGSTVAYLCFCFFQIIVFLSIILFKMLSFSEGRFLLFCSSIVSLFFLVDISYYNGEVSIYGTGYSGSGLLCSIMACYILIYIYLVTNYWFSYVIDEVSIGAAFVIFSPVYTIMLLGLIYAFGYDWIPFVDLPNEWVYIKGRLASQYRTVFLPF